MSEKGDRDVDLAKEIATLETEIEAHRAVLQVTEARKAELEEKRKSLRRTALRGLVTDLIAHTALSDVDTITETNESLDGITADYGVLPCPRGAGRSLVNVRVFAAFERKGYVSTAYAVDGRNNSYRDDETIVVEILIPRRDVEESMTKHGFTP